MADLPAVETVPADPPYVAVVLLRGEHDLATRDAIGATLDPLEGDVLVDLAACTFIDSSVIGILLASADRLRGEGHHLDLVAPAANETVRRVLEIVDIASVVTVHERRP